MNFVISRFWGLYSKKPLGFLDILKFVFTFQLHLSETSPEKQISKSTWCLLGSCRCFPQQRKFPQCFSLNSHSPELAEPLRGSSEMPQPAINFLGYKFFHTWDASPTSQGRMGSFGAQVGSGPPNQQPNKSSSVSTLCIILNFMEHTRGFGLLNFNIRKKNLII